MFKWFKNKKKDNKGFTLVELVIVIAILAILVGLLAPQYTKYVEKSRKAADASNMDEMVKVVKVYAADPTHELEAGKYTITIATTTTTTNGEKIGTTITSAALINTPGTTATAPSTTGLKSELDSSIPNWKSTVTKSQKWDAGKPIAITAEVTVNEDGGTSVKYGGGDFATYMQTGSEPTGN